MDLAKPGDQFRASDTALWGIVALVTWSVVLLGATAAAFIPDSVLGGLHVSRLQGATTNQLRTQLSLLEAEAARLRQENIILTQRFTLAEQASNDFSRRIGALESTVPQILEALAAPGPGIDPGTTASIGTTGATSFDVPGGSVSYTTTPMSSLSTKPDAGAQQQMPQAIVSITPNSAAFGIALGPPIESENGDSTWRSLNDRVGTLLLGLGPLLANVEGAAGKRLVAGPIASEAEARQLCGQMAKVGIACASVPFVGRPLAN